MAIQHASLSAVFEDDPKIVADFQKQHRKWRRELKRADKAAPLAVKPAGANDPLTLKQAMDELGWKSYATTLRYFENIEGVIIKPGKKLRGRTRRMFTIPRKVFEIEKAKMGERTSIDDVVEAANEKMRQSHFRSR